MRDEQRVVGERAENGFVSGGRNPNWEPVCNTCPRLIRRPALNISGGWCGHPLNRVPPSKGWPDGFTPSVSASGGCDLHPLATPTPEGDR